MVYFEGQKKKKSLRHHVCLQEFCTDISSTKHEMHKPSRLGLRDRFCLRIKKYSYAIIHLAKAKRS